MRGRLAAVLTLVAALLVLAGRADADLPAPTVPEEVADVFARDVLPWVVADPSGKDADAIGEITGVDSVREAFGFTTNFLRGDATADPIRRLDQWCGVLRAGRAGVGVVHVQPQDGTMRPVRFSMDADLAAQLDRNRNGYYIEGPPQVGSWVLADQMLTPVDEFARRISAQPMTLASAAPLLQQSWVAAQGGPPSLLQAAMLAVGALLLIGLGLVIIARANAAGRRGRGSPPATPLPS